MVIDEATLNQFLAALTVFILAIIAWYNRQRTASAAVTAAATTQTAMTNQVMAAAPQMAPVPVTVAAAPTTGDGFVLPRDGSKIMAGVDGWWVRINPSKEAATLPDDKCYQAVSPKANFWSGDKETVIYLVTNPDAAGWRARYA